MLIGELAGRARVSIDTIRFYEKKGLLEPRHRRRLSNGYRDYGEEAVARLELLRVGKLLGFTLAELKRLVHDWESGHINNAAKHELFTEKLKDVDRKIGELRGVREFLLTKLKMYAPRAKRARRST